MTYRELKEMDALRGKPKSEMSIVELHRFYNLRYSFWKDYPNETFYAIFESYIESKIEELLND